MATKVTLSSPPVQHQLLHDQPPVDGYHHQHEQPPAQQKQQQKQQQNQGDHHYGQTEDALSGYEYAPKRPPTPPKPKQQVPSWKQHRHSKSKDVNNAANGYYPDSPDQSQSTTTTPNINNQKKTPTMNQTSSAYDYDHQQYIYHQQALKAENNKKGHHVQQPPPSLKKHKDQLAELFMVQEQLDQASRERDRFMEENTQLRYHLQVLHFRMQNVEYMWQSYNAAAAAAAQMWDDSNNSTKPQQQRQHQYPYPYDPFGPTPPPAPPPLDFISLSSRSLPEQQHQRPLKSQLSDDAFRGHQRFRRYRSKSLPRKTSIQDNNDNPYSLHQSMMMAPPPMFSSIMAKLPIPPPPPPPMFDRPPPPFGPRMYHDPLLDPNNNNNTMDDNDDGNSGSEDEMDGINTMRQRQRQMYNDGDFMTEGPPPSMLPPFPPPPPPNTSFYPMYRYHQNTSSRSLPMGPPPPFGPPSYYPGDDKEDKWDQRSIIPPPLVDRPPYDYGNRPTTRFNMYSREEAMQQQRQPWMVSDPSLKLGLASKQSSSSYGDPLQQQQQQQAFYSPRHRRAHLHGPRNG